ncbi:GGDEF domain-containing protein [Treponema sp.]|uniref:GGDEF domain-containing protein n=1 Tax=Treponema sp. TaxID=166 RepID=UPI00298E8D73|nr:GGDEF domain-containing protein [Treponema sp.]MCQ2240254.1 GGDEF domain-containing protein [Treponema sp.]
MGIKNKIKKEHFKARDLNLVMIVVSSTVFAILLTFAILSASRLKHFKDSLTKASVFRNCSLKMMETSDFLTDQSRLFAVTGELQYLKNYFTEKNETKKRNEALQELEKIFSYDEIEFKKLQTAFAQSESLSEIEVYAMKLIILSGQYDMDDLPEEIIKTEVKDIDKKLPKLEMKDKAVKLLFNSSYLVCKSRINENCSILINSIEATNETEVNENFDELREKILWQSVTLVLVFILLVIVFIINIIFIISPINSYMTSIESDSKLIETGSFELRCLAKTYNKFFDIKAANERKLKRHADTDPLTGLFNRRAFTEICNDFSGETQNVAFLLIDVDNFKSVNDTYGHIAGDNVLKIISHELTDTFRTSDFVARIGGDEFAVLLTEFTSDANSTVRRKINEINERLLKLNEYGKVSLSVGAAQSNSGYNKELVDMADKALYKTKEEGKCGFNMYGVEL